MAVYKRYVIQRKYINGVATDEYRVATATSEQFHTLEDCEKGNGGDDGDCTDIEYQWVDVTGDDNYICDGTSKYQRQKKQQKCKDATEWADVYPYEYQKGSLIESNSTDCGMEYFHVYLLNNTNGYLTVTPSKASYSSADTVTITQTPYQSYSFSHYQYGSSSGILNNINFNSILSLSMTNDWYVSGVWSYMSSSSSITDHECSSDHGWVYYSFTDGSEEYAKTLSRSAYIDNNSFNSYSSHSFGDIVVVSDLCGAISIVKNSAFGSCYYLETVDLKGCNLIAVGAFENCKSLTSVYIPNCTYIGANAFESTNISSISLPLCQEIKMYAFWGCKNLTDVYLGWSSMVDMWQFYDIGNNSSFIADVFNGCNSNLKIHIPENLCKSYNDFYGSHSVRLYNSSSSSYYRYFSDIFTCDYERINYSSGSLYISYNDGTESWVYHSWNYIDSVMWGISSVVIVSDFGANIKSITLSAFESNSYLLNVYFPSCSYVGRKAFKSCINLSSISFPQCVSINEDAFNNCNIISLDLPKCIYISEGAFGLNESIQSLSLPLCYYIGAFAFEPLNYNYYLSSVSLPNCTTIGYAAFRNCVALSNVYLDSPTVVSFGCDHTSYQRYSENVFSYCHSNLKIHIPSSLCESYNNKYGQYSVLLSNSVVKYYSEIFVCDLDSSGNIIPSSSSSTSSVVSSYYLVLNTDGNGTINATPSKNYYSSTDVVTISNTANTSYIFSWYQYGSTIAYGSTTTSLVFSLTMSHDWYVSGVWSYMSSSSSATNYGRLYYSYGYGSEMYYSYSSSTISDTDFGGAFAYIISDLTGGIAYIGSYAFDICSNLQTVSFPGCAYIGSDAFYYCSNLQSVYFPLCSYIDEDAFNHCYSLSTVSFPKCSYIGEGAFAICSNLQSANFPECTYIGSSAFEACSKLQSVYFPLCSSIGSSAFIGCDSLSTVSFPMCSYIGSYAFYGCYSLTTVSFPECTYIGSYAFYDCSNLQSVYFPLCSYIGDGAFYDCSNLQSVSFPECTYIGCSAFAICSNLQSANFPLCSSIGSEAFYYCSNLQSANFPLCTYIGHWAFRYCYSLTTVSFPECTYIGYSAFEDCSNLQSVSFPECTYIGYSAFEACSNLQSVYFPLCSSIGDGAFEACSNLQSVSFPMCSSIGSDAFKNCHNLTDIYLGNGSIVFFVSMNSIFSYCHSNLKIHIPSSLCESYNNKYGQYSVLLSNGIVKYYSEIFVCDLDSSGNIIPSSSSSSINGDRCLYYSYSNGSESYYTYSGSTLTNNNFSGYRASIISDLCGVITYIDKDAFRSCLNLQSVSFPGCTYIGSSAFRSCSYLQSVYFPLCSSIGSSAFYGCSKLQSANFPECTYIGSEAFRYCYSLTTVSFPLCSYIDEDAFYACSKLQSANFTECTYIDDGAFYSCSNLQSANFPECTYIGSDAFHSCSKLQSVYFPLCSYIGEGAFIGCDSLTTVSFPECTYIGSYAFAGCDSLTTVSFPMCSYIGSYGVFRYCSNLQSIYLLNSSMCSIKLYSDTTSYSYHPFYQCSETLSIYVPSSLYSSYIATYSNRYTYLINASGKTVIRYYSEMFVSM